MDRRRFLKLAGMSVAGVGLGLPNLAWGSREKKAFRPGKKVAILGGGVAGLSAAHELLERGFEVSVYEKKSIAGGKARSIGVPGSGTHGRKDLPGEHGFRFFPGFYQHLTDTMRRIPYGSNRQGVFDNLVSPKVTRFAQIGKCDVLIPNQAHLQNGNAQLLFNLLSHYDQDVRIPPSELAHFANRLQVLRTSCMERRYYEFEKISWFDFVGASSRSPQFQRFLAIGPTRSLVAMRAEHSSARTVGYVLMQLLGSVSDSAGHIDRVLNGPTNEVWIDPWMDYLKSRGLNYQSDSIVKSFECANGEICGALIEQDDKEKTIVADFYIAALPVEKMQPLLSKDMIALDPLLERIKRLQYESMVGIQLFLKKDVPLNHGHTLYFDSPWALTSISQQQFWPTHPLGSYGNGEARGVLSVDISNWNTPGLVFKKPAKQCTPEQIKIEVLYQLRKHLYKNPGDDFLSDENILTTFLDPGVTFSETGVIENEEPLFIHPQGSWYDRPDAVTAIPNFFLASDYVKAHSDLACMETANEAARRAVNGILEISGSNASRCGIWRFRESAAAQYEQMIDSARFKMGLSNLYYYT